MKIITKPKPPAAKDEPQIAKPKSGLISRRELAERWRCCPHTIARRPDLKPVRFNKRFLRYRIEDVEAVEAAAIS